MTEREEGVMVGLQDVAGALRPLWMRRLQDEIDARVAEVPTEVNEFGFDGYGLSPEYAAGSLLPSALLYRYYFRVETHDIDRVPPGPVLLIANHAGQLPFDGMMVSMAMLLEAEPPRLVRSMAEYFVPQLPWLGVAAARTGSMVGTPRNCLSMLERGECVLAFPEGARGMNKVFSERYKLQRFGLGFVRLALEAHVPIVPISIVGSEEQQPGLANLSGVARLLGLPALPITAGLLVGGPLLGMLPLPVKYRMYFHEPLRFEGDPADEDAKIQEKVDVVKAAIEAGFERGLEERSGVFT